MRKIYEKRYCITIVSWVAVILWMALIFNLSSQVAEQSNQLSKGVTKVIVETVAKVAPQAEFDIESFNHIVRKNAHFLAYLVLGILVLNALRRSGVTGTRSITLTLAICILYAVSARGKPWQGKPTRIYQKVPGTLVN